jgi:hypothetical protein
VSVEVGLKLPQAPVLPQVTDQVTPAVSLVVAVIATVAPVLSVDGAPERLTVMTTGTVIVIVAEADLVVSLTEVAVTVTVLPVGAAAGAV